MEPTSTTRTLSISGMTGETCIQKVTAALQGVPGISTQSVRVGIAVITSPDLGRTTAACAAINSAGFKASQLDSSDCSKTTDCNKTADPAANLQASRMNGNKPSTPLVPAAPANGATPHVTPLVAVAPAAAAPVG